MTTLNDLRPGERGAIVAWVGDEPPVRLLEMGVLEGTEVEVVRLAPLGDPIEIRIRGCHLSIRKHEAGKIKVQPA